LGAGIPIIVVSLTRGSSRCHSTSARWAAGSSTAGSSPRARALSTVAGEQLEAIAERIVDVQAPPRERPSLAAWRRPPRVR